MLLTRIKRAHVRMWHYALTSEIEPTCGCICPSAGRRRTLNGALCRCHCHSLGLANALSLCEKARLVDCKDMKGAVQTTLLFCQDFEDRTRPAKAIAEKRGPWRVVKGRDPGCMSCQAIGAKLTEGELGFFQKERDR